MEPKKLLTDFKTATKSDWSAEAEIAIKGKSLTSLTNKSAEGIEIYPIYFREDLNYNIIGKDAPGSYPYRRGSSEYPYRDAPWLICSEITHYNPVEYNTTAIHEITRGASSISLKVLNPDVEFDLRNTGTYISDLDSLASALNGIDLNDCTLYFSYDSTTVYTLDYLIEYLNRNYPIKDKITIFASYDYFTEILEKGHTLMSFSDYLNHLTNYSLKIVSYNNFKLSGINSFSYRDMGSNTTQEMAFCISSAFEIITHLRNEDIDLENLISHFHLNMSVSNDFFMEIAKFRATRVIWATIIKTVLQEQFEAKINIRAISSVTNKSALDEHTNMLRETTETLSAVIGGCNSITMRPFDNPLLSNDEFARRIARNTQLVIANECNQLDTIDPAGGSWYIESLTYELIQKTWEMIMSIENEGGFLKTIENGTIRNLINNSQKSRLADLFTRKEIMIGVNKYPNTKDNPENADIVNYVNSANAFRKNLKIPFQITTSDFKATTNKIEKIDLSATFIELRKQAERIKKSTGKNPQAYLVGFGPLKQYKPRMDFSREFLSVGGFECISAEGLNSVTEAISHFDKSNCKIVVLCSTDESYTDIVPAFAQAVRQSHPDAVIVLAGYPKDMTDSYRHAGIDEFIHIKANICDVLSGLLAKLEKRG